MKGIIEHYKSAKFSYIFSFFGLLFTYITQNFVFFGVGILIGPTLDIIIWRNKNKKEQEDANEKQIRASRIEFYKLCKNSRISTFTSAQNMQKGELIAKQLNLPIHNLQETYDEGKRLVQDEKKALKEAELNEMRAKEKKEQTELLRFSGLTGRNKRIAMLQAMHDEAISRANSYDAMSRILIASSNLKEKEDTWGYAGGIASAIAGPAAGAAAAIESQRCTAQENARIREQNELNKKWAAPLILTQIENEREARERASSLAAKLKAGEICLVSDELTSQECFDKLSFTKVKVEQSKTGTYTISALVTFEKFHIFENVPAVIDGEVLATIYRDGTKVATASAVFPVDGAKNAWIKGMALYCDKKSKKTSTYEVKFSPKKLWAMEDME